MAKVSNFKKTMRVRTKKINVPSPTLQFSVQFRSAKREGTTVNNS